MLVLHVSGKSDVILCSLVLMKIKAYPQFQAENKNMSKRARVHIMQAGEKKKSAFPMTNKKVKTGPEINLYPFSLLYQLVNE